MCPTFWSWLSVFNSGQWNRKRNSSCYKKSVCLSRLMISLESRERVKANSLAESPLVRHILPKSNSSHSDYPFWKFNGRSVFPRDRLVSRASLLERNLNWRCVVCINAERYRIFKSNRIVLGQFRARYQLFGTEMFNHVNAEKTGE